MSYHFFSYSLFFLPLFILIYQLCPKKIRCYVVLVFDFLFFYLISDNFLLVLYLIGTTIVAYLTGYKLNSLISEKKYSGKQLTKIKRVYLWFGISINLVALVLLKYFKVFGIGETWLVPIGISYYTLQAISYMTDVYRGTELFDNNIIKMFLYLSYFPQIVEGPISRYGQVTNSIYEGHSITYKNLTYGYQRIIWGLFKKMLVADRLAPLVSKVFDSYESMDGVAVVIGAVCFTIQLYAEFSGCMDIVIGTGEIFGVTLPENFRQPFFAKSAGEFWRRWHITLGTWLKDYVFYPISLAKPVKKLSKKFKNWFGIGVSKFVAPTIALFFVWLANGIWHGPRTNYLFYGMYYFVIIFIENITENSMTKFTDKYKINRKSKIYKGLQITRLMIIVILGEMFFRANSFFDGFNMLYRAIVDFHIKNIPSTNFGVDIYDVIIAAIYFIFVIITDVIKEKGIIIRDKINDMKLPIRWMIWYFIIMSILIFGAYGKGYSFIDMIYAAY